MIEGTKFKNTFLSLFFWFIRLKSLKRNWKQQKLVIIGQSFTKICHKNLNQPISSQNRWAFWRFCIFTFFKSSYAFMKEPAHAYGRLGD